MPLKSDQRIPDDVSSHYSAAVFVLFATFTTLYQLLAFLSFARFYNLHGDHHHTVGLTLACLAIACRTISIPLVWIIWLTKTGLQGKAPSAVFHHRFHSWLPMMQALYPIVISSALICRLFAHLVIGRCHNGIFDGFCNPYYEGGGMSLTLATELMFNPIVIAFLLRDTRIEALLFAWFSAVGMLVAFCAVLETPDLIVATVGYVFCSVLLYWDNERHRRALLAVLGDLKQALVENEQLSRAAQALELKAMIGNVAHDLKTPLTSFLNGIECVMEIVSSWEAQDTPTRQTKFLERSRGNLAAIRKCLHEMKSTTAFMTMSINRCLDYTKANAGVNLVPRPETVYLRNLLDMPLKMMRDMLSNRTITLTELDERICSHVITDKQWLLENLLCLLSNAIKFSTKGGVDVAVQLVSLEAAVEGNADQTTVTEHLRFEVQDTGIGLSDEEMSRLFAPFKQAQRLAGGTGLGLFSLARRVEALHGQYGVSKRPDGEQGSLFWFTIPYRPDHATAELNSESSAKSSTIISLSDDSSRFRDGSGRDSSKECFGRDPTAQRYSVLVVDDSPMIVRMTTMLLTRMGHTVKHAGNGAEALDMIIAGYTEDTSKSYEDAGAPPYDVVLMDLQMPIMDGPLAMRRLRAEEERLRGGECKEPQKESAGVWGSAESDPRSCMRHQQEWKQDDSKGSGGTSSGGGSGGSSGRSRVHFSEGGVEDSAGDIELGLAGLRHFSRGPHSPVLSLPHHRYHQLVIAVSANSDHETVEDALSAGADEFMVKPFSYETFAELMERNSSV